MLQMGTDTLDAHWVLPQQIPMFLHKRQWMKSESESESEHSNTQRGEGSLVNFFPAALFETWVDFIRMNKYIVFDVIKNSKQIAPQFEHVHGAQQACYSHSFRP